MKRIQFIDSLKGFTIFCVLWGHSIQHFRNGDDAFVNPNFEIIYSFHMPLFFLISGMFFKSSLELGFVNFFSKKIGQLLLPCFVWAVIFCALRLGFCYYNSGCDVDWLVEARKLIIPFKWPFWFLKQLFFSYSLAYVFYKVFKKEWMAILMLIGFVLVIPYGDMQRFLSPVFLVGVLIKSNYHVIQDRLRIFLYCSGLIFIICLVFWKGEYTIYVTGFPPLINLKTVSFNFHNILISLFRLLTGVSGSVFFLLLFQKIYKKNQFHSTLEVIGSHTLSIYILQFSLIEINPFPDFQSQGIWIYNLIISPFVSLLVLVISMGVIFLVSRSKSVGKILFGSSFRKLI